MIYSSFGLWRLAIAMAKHEGWAPADPATGYPGSASFRRRNPGNLRASPFVHTIDAGFCAFIDDFHGWSAFIYDLEQKAKGNTSTGLTGASTIRDLINVWAPPSDNNNTAAYLADVVATSGLSATATLQSLLV